MPRVFEAPLRFSVFRPNDSVVEGRGDEFSEGRRESEWVRDSTLRFDTSVHAEFGAAVRKHGQVF